MKAINLFKVGSKPAPKEWGNIPEIKVQRPKGVNHETSLQKLDGFNICIWMIGLGGLWSPASDFFYIKSK